MNGIHIEDDGELSFIALLSIIIEKISISLDGVGSIIIDNTAFSFFLVSPFHSEILRDQKNRKCGVVCNYRPKTRLKL